MAAPVSPARQAAGATDIIVFMDGDGADDPSAIAGLTAPIRSGAYDFVIGSRARGEREPGSMAGHQLFAGLAAGALIKLLYGVRYTDMCAFRAIRRDTLLKLGMRELTTAGIWKCRCARRGRACACWRFRSPTGGGAAGNPRSPAICAAA